MCLPSVNGSLARFTSLAEDVKLSTYGREPSLCFFFFLFCERKANGEKWEKKEGQRRYGSGIEAV